MKKILISVIALMVLCSCSTQESLYSWYNYENAVYKYNKRHTDELKANVLKQYQKMTDKQKGTRGIVPPGLYAEYGYMLYKNGKPKEGLAFLRQEIKLYPESTAYISRIIKQLEK